MLAQAVVSNMNELVRVGDNHIQNCRLRRTLEVVRASRQSFLLGVSLSGNRFFSKQTVSTYFQHLAGDEAPFVVLIADSLEAINYEYFRDLPPTESSQRAMATGQMYLRGYCKLKHSFPSLYPLLSSDLNQASVMQNCVYAVSRMFRQNLEFRKAVRDEVVSNLGARSFKSITQCTQDDPALERYILGEIALSLFFCALPTHGKLTQVSRNGAGILSTLTNYPELFRQAEIPVTKYEYLYWNPMESSHVA